MSSLRHWTRPQIGGEESGGYIRVWERTKNWWLYFLSRYIPLAGTISHALTVSACVGIISKPFIEVIDGCVSTSGREREVVSCG